MQRRTAMRPAAGPMVEGLEARRLMSGNVIATYNSVSGGLAIKGDAKANSIVISYETTGTFAVTGQAGTKVNNGAALVLPGGAYGPITVDMGNGDDTVVVDIFPSFNVYPGAPISINTGKGDDTVVLNPLIVAPGGSISIDTGAGNDKVSFLTRVGDFYIGDLGQPAWISVNLGSGNDRITMENFVLFGGSIKIDAGSGADVIDFPPLGFGGGRVANPGQPIDILTGPGNDIINGLNSIEGGVITVT